jgi:hypothetical protein
MIRALPAVAGLMLIPAPAALPAPLFAQVQPGVQIPPNRGTAPDWLVICGDTARRRFGVAQDAVHLDTPRFMRSLRIVEGHAGSARFRCSVDLSDRLRAFTRLPPSSNRGRVGR